MGPHNVAGIEINPYAAELARVSIWVGHIQWMLENGFNYSRDPILQPLHNIERRDAILVREEGEPPRRAEWPDAAFIVGNPPFLGAQLLRQTPARLYRGTLRRGCGTGTCAGRLRVRV